LKEYQISGLSASTLNPIQQKNIKQQKSILYIDPENCYSFQIQSTQAKEKEG
jgi:hypothetical protein